MTNEMSIDEIDYDSLVDYELCHMNDGESADNNSDEIFLVTNIGDSDTLEVVLEKISKTHEDFYKVCFENISAGEESDQQKSENLHNSIDDKTNRIINSLNLTYENFVDALSKMKMNVENEEDKILVDNDKPKETSNDAKLIESPMQALINHENILQQINDEKWSEYDKFYQNFGERCKSARSVSQKQLQDEVSIEQSRRQTLQDTLAQELKRLEESMKMEETENKMRLLELESEIQRERQFLFKLKNDSKELLDFKRNWAAITIQKNFRRYRIRKRIGSQVDDARNAAKRKLFNTKLIISEKEAQKQKAIKLRKWRKQQEMDKNKKEHHSESKIVASKSLGSLKPDLNNFHELPIEEEKSVPDDYLCKNKLVNKIAITDDDGNIIRKNTKENNITELSNSTLDSRPFNLIESVCIREEEFTNDNKININDQSDIMNEARNKYEGLINKNDDITKLVPGNDTDIDEHADIVNKMIINDIALQNNNNNIYRESVDLVEESGDIKLCFNNEFNVNPSMEIIESETGNVIDKMSNTRQSIEIDDCRITANVNNDPHDEQQLSINHSLLIEKEGELLDRWHEPAYISEESSNGLYKDQSHCSEEIVSNEDMDVKIQPDLLFTLVRTSDNLITKSNDAVGDIAAIEALNNEAVAAIVATNTIPDFTDPQINPNNEMNGHIIEIDSVVDNNSPSNVYGIHHLHPSKVSDALDESLESHMVSDRILKTGTIHVANENGAQAHIDDEANNYRSAEQENKQEYIDENYLATIFQGNRRMLSICISWMNQKAEEKAVHCIIGKVDVVDQSIPSVPKHLMEYSKVNVLVGNICDGSADQGPGCNSDNTGKSLSIIGKQLSSVSNLKERFPSVEHLILNSNLLKSFYSADVPDSIRSLSINENKLEWAYFGNNTQSSLTILSCSSNDLCGLPRNTFRNCQNLIHIDFSCNNFMTIESIFGGNESLKNLCSINLNNNVLSNIDNLCYYCPNLTHLSLSGNHIRHWTNANQFPFLVDLDISHNSLSSLQTWNNTPLLVNLNLSHNGINNLDLFAHSWMPCLSVLSLDSNKLQNIPVLFFPSLQDLSVQRNFLQGSINYEVLFQDCPLLAFINLKDNVGSDVCQRRGPNNKIINDPESPQDMPIPCPDGEFQSACFDFADSVHQKSLKLKNVLSSASPSAELIYKHQFHFYRYVREISEELSSWMSDFLFHVPISNKAIETVTIHSPRQILAVIKIQSIWRGYKTRKWFKIIVSRIKYDTEKGFEELGPIDISEFDKTDLLHNWTDMKSSHRPTNAWMVTVERRESDTSPVRKSKRSIECDGDELIIQANHSTYRSNSTTCLSKKGMDIMKEWGFECPNSALWMMERAKKFQKKPDKIHKNVTNKQFSIFSQKPPPSVAPNRTASVYKKPQVASINTLTIEPPSTIQNTSYQSKIDEWVVDSNYRTCSPPTLNPIKKSFLPSIELDHQFNKIPVTFARPKSSNTKLPSISYLH